MKTCPKCKSTSFLLTITDIVKAEVDSDNTLQTTESIMDDGRIQYVQCEKCGEYINPNHFDI